jgi:hypothetical protein
MKALTVTPTDTGHGLMVALEPCAHNPCPFDHHVADGDVLMVVERNPRCDGHLRNDRNALSVVGVADACEVLTQRTALGVLTTVGSI